jgi:integrase
VWRRRRVVEAADGDDACLVPSSWPSARRVKEARVVLAPSQALDDQIEGAYSEHFAPRWTPLVAEEVLTRNVASFAKPTRPRQHRFQTWSVAEATTFLAAIREHRLYALFAVDIALGMRRGEALGLRWEE